MEVALFHRQRKATLPTTVKAQKNLTRMQSAAQFYGENKRPVLLKKMREQSALEDSRYEHLCIPLLESLVDHCQNLPESFNSYYSQPGGIVDFALNRTEAALSLFMDFMVMDESNDFSEDQKLWQYALYTAALLQGIGKIFVEYKVRVFDAQGQFLKQWNALLGSLVSSGVYYDYDFEKESDVDFRRRINLLLARALMPQSGFAWIASNPEVLAVWLALLHEDLGSAGTLGAILIRANALAIKRYIREFMGKTAAQRSGRYGRSGTFSGGTPASVAEKEQQIGLEFIQWLTKALGDGALLVNKAPLFMVPGGMLMSKEMFALFVREHPEYKNWQAIQKGFLSLGLHNLGSEGAGLGRLEQDNSQTTDNEIVFSQYAVVLPDSVHVHHLHSGTVETMSAMELIHKAQNSSQFHQGSTSASPESLRKLTASGNWVQAENADEILAPGAKRGA